MKIYNFPKERSCVRVRADSVGLMPRYSLMQQPTTDCRRSDAVDDDDKRFQCF